MKYEDLTTEVKEIAVASYCSHMRIDINSKYKEEVIKWLEKTSRDFFNKDGSLKHKIH